MTRRHITVIWTDSGDIDSLTLKRTFDGLNVTLIHITKDMDLEYAEELVNQAIESEDDFLIWLGHGTAYGLLFPDFSKQAYLIHENNVNLIHAKDVCAISCYASTFACKNKISGFFTSMFISNFQEAADFSILDYDIEMITNVGETFCDRVNQLIRRDVPLSEWLLQIGAKMDVENEIERFNYQGLCYFIYNENA